jgi:hypothetical protein
MNSYHCTILYPEGSKECIIHADTCHQDSTCSTRFSVKVEYKNEWGSVATRFDMIAQYPTDRLIINYVEYDITD